jgi:hypothetical protein
MTRLVLVLAAVALALPAAAQDLGPTLTKIRNAKEIVLGFREFTTVQFVGEQAACRLHRGRRKAVVESLGNSCSCRLPIRWVAVTAENDSGVARRSISNAGPRPWPVALAEVGRRQSSSRRQRARAGD